MKKWLDKYDAPKAQNGIEGTMGGLTDIGFNYNGAWGGTMAMGGSLPGAVGFTYARTGSIPSNGPYAKKTKASAQNGQEMKFYQEGLDWKPKTISKKGSKIKKDDMGYWNPENWGEPVEIGSNEITMQGVYEPLLGISNTGDTQMMYPGEDYTFDGESVTEYPVMQQGGKVPTPTMADSLALYNNALKVIKYYKDKKYEGNDPIYSNFLNKDVFGQLEQARNTFNKYNKVNVPGSSGKSIDVDREKLKDVYYKEVDANKFFQREMANSILDTRSPMPLYDKRITPTVFYGFSNKMEKDPLWLDAVSLWGYDPIAVKPYSMLTPEEKKLREQRYGKPQQQTVVTSKPAVKPKQVTKPEPKKQEPVKEIKKEQPKPVEKKQNVYEGTPVYSPGAGSGLPSALVGFLNQKGDTTFIKPEDYERFAVPKYGKEFIESKKKKNGGWLDKYK
jgi:hypothetical protein